MVAFAPIYPITPPGSGRFGDPAHLTLPHALDLPVTERRFFALPVGLPAGTPKLRLLSRGQTTAGALSLGVAWRVAEAGDDPDAASTVNEGSTVIPWTTATGYHDTRVPLDGAALTAGGILVVRLTGEAASTIAVETTHLLMLIWE